MAARDLTSGDFDLAFAFARSEAASYRDAAGEVQTAAADVPRFDHDDAGAALGLLITAGADLGGGDRITLDPLILPVDVLPSPQVPKPPVTVLHHFDRGAGAERRAWYSLDAEATVAALLRQVGHHISIGVVPGFLRNEAAPLAIGPGVAGYVRYRGQDWILPRILGSGAAALEDGVGRPLIQAGT